jgi:hypothetical protein
VTASLFQIANVLAHFAGSCVSPISSRSVDTHMLVVCEATDARHANQHSIFNTQDSKASQHSRSHSHRQFVVVVVDQDAKQRKMGLLSGDDAVDEEKIILCCALCCVHCGIYTGGDCPGCSGKCGLCCLNLEMCCKPGTCTCTGSSHVRFCLWIAA